MVRVTVVSTGYSNISNTTTIVLNKVKASPTRNMTSQMNLRTTFLVRPALFRPEIPILKCIPFEISLNVELTLLSYTDRRVKFIGFLA